MLNNWSRDPRRGSSFGSTTSAGRAHGGRFGYAGRNPGRGRGSSWQKHKPQNLPDTSLHPLGGLIATIDNSSLDLAALSNSGTPSITNCEYVTSYNWLNEGNPTILVPGKPPLWTPLDTPRPLNEDSGDYFRDPNAARFPSYPTEPAVQALLNTDPNFSMSSVDVFACGSTMGNLLRFVRSVDKSFRFSVEAVNGIVFFIRKENDPRELIDGVRGYGHTFPENYTTWEKDVRSSETHQRVVQYRFGGFKCLVRFECDGYLGDSIARNAYDDGDSGTSSEDEDVANIFGAVTVSQHTSTTNDLTLKAGGTVVQQASIFDLKTRSGKWGKEIDMDDQLPSLWVKQIPNFVVAYHNGAGLFEKNKIQVRKVRDEIQKWETDNRAALNRMAALIRKIIDFAKVNEEHRIEVYCPSVNRLEIRKQVKGTPGVLPESLKARLATRPDVALNAVAKQYSDSEEEDDEDDNRKEAVDFKDYGGRKIPSGSKGDGGGIDLDSFYEELMMGKYPSDQEEEPDYTACSAEDCGYCGRCHYD